jgi:RNA polymerase sigma-70 factor (ECF subfamily)
MPEIKSEQLIAQYLKGDTSALDALVKRYLPLIFGFVQSYVKDAAVADDLTQEAFVKIWKNLDKFKMEKSFKAWSLSIAKNTVIDHFRRRQAVPFSEFDTADGGNLLLDSLADNKPLPLEVAARLESGAQLESALKKLRPQYGRIISLHHYKDLTFREIAQSLKEPLNTVKSHYRRGLAELRKLLPGF